MAYELALQKGIHRLVLSSGNYNLGSDFVPPSTDNNYNLSMSTSANKRDGESFISKKARNGVLEFGILVKGSDAIAIDRAIRELAQILESAGEYNEALLLVWRRDVSLPTPIWGQFGAPLSIEIVYGEIKRDALYGVNTVKNTMAYITLYLETRPYWKGIKQALVAANGGILEERFMYYPDGRSRGLMILTQTENKFINPVLGKKGVVDLRWTAVTVALEWNVNPEYYLFCGQSMKITSHGGSGQVQQSVTCNTTNTHVISCYVKLTDGGVVSQSNCRLYYNAGIITTNFINLGNGWYRAWGTFTGIVSAKNAGISIESSWTIFADGFQLEEGSTPTELCYGDLPGCEWSGAVHDSTSTRVKGQLVALTESIYQNKYTVTDYVAEMTIAIVWKSGVANTYPFDMQLFSMGPLQAYFKASDDKIYFTDGTSNISSDALTFSAGTVLHVAVVAEQGNMRIYINGIFSGVNSLFYDPGTPGLYLFIGTSAIGTLPLYGTISGFTLYNTALTSTEILTIYTAANRLISLGMTVDQIPYAWTLNSDLFLNCFYDATHGDFQMIDGIGGNAPADTWLNMHFKDVNVQGIYLALSTTENYYTQRSLVKDYQGTVVTGAVNGQVEVTTSYTGSDIMQLFSFTFRQPWKAFVGKTIYIAAYLTDSVAGWKLALSLTGSLDYDNYQQVSGSANIRLFIIGPRIIDEKRLEELPEMDSLDITATLNAMHVGAGTTGKDYGRVVLGKVLFVETSATGVVVNGLRVWAYSMSGASDYGGIASQPPARGEIIEFEPNKVNYITVIQGIHGGLMEPGTYSLRLKSFIYPRWSVI